MDAPTVICASLGCERFPPFLIIKAAGVQLSGR